MTLLNFGYQTNQKKVVGYEKIKYLKKAKTFVDYTEWITAKLAHIVISLSVIISTASIVRGQILQ